MAPLKVELEGSHLGEKHKSYNEILIRVNKGDTEINLKEFGEDDGDLINLLKIDNANSTKNVEFILKVLVCNDMLYVSKALKKCKWLFIEKEYEHIINPRYVNATLIPNMCTKAAIKLIKCIQFHLKDTTRVEQFYEYEDKAEKAVYWLPNCSLDFIKRNLPKHNNHLTEVMLRRLCEKSIKCLEIYIDNCPANYKKIDALEKTIFLLRTNTEEYLNIVEKNYDSQCPKFSAITTKIIMKTCPNRIIGNFDKYCNFIHIPSFIVGLKKENIKDFLLDQAKKALNEKIYIRPEKLKIFVENMPKKERYEFIKKVFIDKEFKIETCPLPDLEKRALNYLHDEICNVRWYKEVWWYKYAPFHVAFTDIKVLLDSSENDEEIKSMLTILITCAGKNVSEINQILHYVRNSKKIRSRTDVKYEFLKQLFSRFNFKNFNEDMWNALQYLAEGENFNENSDNIDVYVWAVICFKVVNSEKVPESIMKLFKFNTLKTHQNKFNETEKQLIFDYLYGHITVKLQNQKCDSEEDLKEWAEIVKDVLSLLIDWNKDLKDYPLLIDDIKKNIKNNLFSKYKIDLTFIYDMKKTWRKYFFDESLYFYQTDKTMINSLKHDPKIIENYAKNENVTLVKFAPIRKFLRKIKVYYPTWLCKDWLNLYNKALDNISEHQKICFGLSTLYSRAEMDKVLIEYAPKVAKLDDADIDELILSLQRHYSKNMHFSRPQPSPERLLMYTKGDYLKYALPSLHSIFYNLSTENSRKFIPQLLDSQVSLQKHGIRLAFCRLQSSESSAIFKELWKSTKNFTIRCVLFKVTFQLLCNEKSQDRVNDLWSLLSSLIDSLTLEENKQIYDLLFEIEKLPSKIQASYYIKVYDFVKKLSRSKEYSENYNYTFNNTFMPYSINVMDDLCPDFVSRILHELISEEFDESNDFDTSYNIGVISSYILSSGDVEMQLKKYNDIFMTYYKNCIEKQKYDKLSTLLDQLKQDVPKTLDKNILPLEMFKTIQNEVLKSVSLIENYVMLTKWKLTVSFLEALHTQPTTNWKEMCTNVAPEFGKICGSILREQCTKHFSYIYVLFSRALKEFLNDFVDDSAIIDVYLNMLDESVESHLVGIKVAKYFTQYRRNDDDVKTKVEKLKTIFSEHPSLEVRIHYHRSFNKFNECFGNSWEFDDFV